jgi:hypothetical protein
VRDSVQKGEHIVRERHWHCFKEYFDKKGLAVARSVSKKWNNDKPVKLRLVTNIL